MKHLYQNYSNPHEHPEKLKIVANSDLYLRRNLKSILAEATSSLLSSQIEDLDQSKSFTSSPPKKDPILYSRAMTA